MSSRLLSNVLVAALLISGLTACGGQSSEGETASSTTTVNDASATTAAPATTSGTATTATVPAAADIEAIVTAYVLGDCDWPEAYPADANPIVATWEDIDAATGDLRALREAWGFPVWEMPIDSDELGNIGLYGYAHRIVELPGTTIVSGAYLFQSPDLALAALDTVESTFNDGPTMAAITGLGYDLTEVAQQQDDPNTTSVVYVIEASQDAWRPRAVRAAAFVVDDVLVTVRGAYPVLDDARVRAYLETEFAAVARLVGSPAGFPSQPLAAAMPEVGTAVAMSGDPWLGDTVAVSGIPQIWPPGAGGWQGPEVHSLSAAELPAADVDPAISPIEMAAFRQFDSAGVGPVFTGMLRFDEAAASEEGFEAIEAAYRDPAQMSLLTAPQPLDTITELDSGASLPAPQTLAIAATNGDGTDPDGSQVVAIVWRIGRDIQWIRARTTNAAAADTIASAFDLAAVMANRIPADLPPSAPALNAGCGPVEGSGAALLGESPWLTGAAVLADGDPWVTDVASGASEAFVLSREEAAAYSTDDWAGVIGTRDTWGVTVSQSEFPVDASFFMDDRMPRLASAYRVHPGDGGGPVLWTGAILFEDTEWDDPATTDVVEQFLTAGMGWANIASSYDPDYAASNGWLFQVTGEDAPPTFDATTLLSVPNLGEQFTAVLITGADSPDQVAAIVWRNGGLTQWVRARMPVGDDVTLQAMISVAEAMAARGG